jgi:hypothetical protein
MATYTLGAWPSYDDMNAALAPMAQRITRIEPWFSGIEQRGLARVHCANQETVASSRYQAFYAARPPSDVHAYNNVLLISLADRTGQPGQGRLHILMWPNQPVNVEEYDAVVAEFFA